MPVMPSIKKKILYLQVKVLLWFHSAALMAVFTKHSKMAAILSTAGAHFAFVFV